MFPTHRFAPFVSVCFITLAALFLMFAIACGGGSSSTSANNSGNTGSASNASNPGTGGSGGSSSGSNSSSPGGGSSSGSSGSSASGGGSSSSSTHFIYAQDYSSHVLLYAAHPAQGKIDPLAGPIATNESAGDGIYYDAPQHLVFAVGMPPNPQRGDVNNQIASVDVRDPQHPVLLNTQSFGGDSIQTMLIDSSGLLPVGVISANFVQSWRYDTIAHTFQQVSSSQFQAGNTPTTWLLPNEQIVVAVTSSGAANGPHTTYVTSFHRNAGSGALSKTGTLTLSDASGSTALTPDGRFLLVPDTQTGAVNIVAIDAGSGALTLAGTSATAGAFLLYRFIDATHVIGRLTINNNDKLTVFTFNQASMSVTAGMTLQLATSSLSIKNIANTIYIAEAGPGGLIEMIAFDPASASLKAIGSIAADASSLDVAAGS